jgi:hypothetical protein
LRKSRALKPGSALFSYQWVSDLNMEVSGLEPLTSCLQSRRSTN